jgi:hypothetical protein
MTAWVIGSPDFHSAYPAQAVSGHCPVPTFLDPNQGSQRLENVHDAVVLVEADCVDQKLSEALVLCAKKGIEVRLLTVASLTKIKCRMEASTPPTEFEIATGNEVGGRVSEKLRTTMGSIRLGSEINVNKARSSRSSLLPDVEALHTEIVNFCESLGFMLDLRVPGGMAVGTWGQFDAFNEIRTALSNVTANTGCIAHIAGQPELPTIGNPRDIARLVFETVSNSIQHGLAKNVWLSSALDPTNGEATLTLDDDGRGFLYRETSDVGFCLRMESKSLKSRGIGVLICRRILSRYKGRIDYSVKPDGGLRVDIRWRPDLKRPDEHSILAPYGLRIEA